MRAVAYLRVSTDRQAEKDLSIPAQLQAIKGWAEKHQCDIVREFVDKGESAKSADRPAFLDMIAYCKATPGLDAVLVYHLDRFSRSRWDHAVYKAMLRKVGIRVVSVTTPLDESPEGMVLEGVLETFSEYYSRNLSRVTTRGMRQAVEAKSSRPGGATPFGFRSVRKDGRVTLEIIPREAEIVRRMADLILRGYPLGEVRSSLEREGVKNRQGVQFTKSQLHRILHNPAVVGDLAWNRHQRGQGSSLKPVTVWVTVQAAWPPILDRKTFVRVQNMLAERAPTPTFRRSASAAHLLTGLLMCARCGAPYSVEQAKSGQYLYYDCSQRMKHGKHACPGRRLPHAKTEHAVIRGIMDWLFDEKKAARIVAWYLKRTGVDEAGVAKREQELTRWETQLSARKERLLDALENGKIAAELLSDRFHRLDEERVQLTKGRQELERLKAKAVPIPTVEMFRSIGAELRRRCEEGPKPIAKALLRRLVRRIVVSREGVLNIELVIGSPRNNSGSGDEFVPTTNWWPYRDSNPSFSLERAAS